VKAQGALAEKLKELEAKIRILLSEVSRSRQEKKDLMAAMKELEAKVTALAEQLDVERTEKEQLGLELKQVAEEKEEIRSKVEGMLAEVSRMESSLSEPA
jgi:chromosome segregation ATPase